MNARPAWLRAGGPLPPAPILLYVWPESPNKREAVRSRSWDLRTRSAYLLHRWGNWWRIVWAWRSAPVADRFLALCSYCGCVRDHSGRWVEIPPEIARRFHLDSGPQVTHSVCTHCLVRVESSLGRPPAA
jgi:hypothetical protein